MDIEEIKAKLVDVFAKRPLTGNGLAIFWNYDDLSTEHMQNLTREMRQFESIFVDNTAGENDFRARIFTMEEELDFAGHPLIGLGAHLHEEYGSKKTEEWKVQLNSRVVHLISHQSGEYFSAEMQQGSPNFIKTLTSEENLEIFSSLNLKHKHIAELPLEVISTGLPYLIVPVKKGIEKAQIITNDFEHTLKKHDAKFVFVLDINKKEGRTWDNQGKVEDVATGSAAGPAVAFLYKHNLISTNKTITLRQGRFVDRASKIEAELKAQDGRIESIIVKGNVSKVADILF